jgi:hypothetical protein
VCVKRERERERQRENGVLFSHKEELNYVTCRKMEKTADHHVT